MWTNETCQNFIYAWEICLSLYRLSRNLLLLNSIRQRPSTPNFIQIGHEMWKLQVEIRFRRSAMRDCHWVDFRETQGLFDNSLFKKIPIPIPKFMIPHKRCSCRQRVTNGRTCSPLFRKEGLIWQIIFERYIPTVNTTRLPLPNICLCSNPTQSSFIGGANDR